MSDSDSSSLQQEIFDSLRRLQVENFCIVSSSALLFFDFAITLSPEIQRIWKRRFSGATVVYLLTRYSALFERVTLLVSLFLVTTVDKKCAPVMRLDDTLTDLNYAAIGAFTALRLLGVYGSNGFLGVILIGIIWVARIALSVYHQVSYVPIAFGPPLFGCGGVWYGDVNKLDHLDTAANSLMLASDILLVLLTWARTWRVWLYANRTGSSTPISSLVLRDGTIYFVLILVIQIFAIVSSEIGSTFILFDVWTYFGQVFTVIFLTRFMLNLRGVTTPDPSMTTGTFQTVTFPLTSDLHFASNLVGNLGAPLDSVVGVGLSNVTEGKDFDEEKTGWEIDEEGQDVGVLPQSLPAIREDVEMNNSRSQYAGY